VDGNFALLRRGDIQFSVEMSSKEIINTMASGEGLLQTFRRGTGEVWLAPTQAVYNTLKLAGGTQALTGKGSHTDTRK